MIAEPSPSSNRALKVPSPRNVKVIMWKESVGSWRVTSAGPVPVRSCPTASSPEPMLRSSDPDCAGGRGSELGGDCGAAFDGLDWSSGAVSTPTPVPTTQPTRRSATAATANTHHRWSSGGPLAGAGAGGQPAGPPGLPGPLTGALPGPLVGGVPKPPLGGVANGGEVGAGPGPPPAGGRPVTTVGSSCRLDGPLAGEPVGAPLWPWGSPAGAPLWPWGLPAGAPL